MMEDDEDVERLRLVLSSSSDEEEDDIIMKDAKERSDLSVEVLETVTVDVERTLAVKLNKMAELDLQLTSESVEQVVTATAGKRDVFEDVDEESLGVKQCRVLLRKLKADSYEEKTGDDGPGVEQMSGVESKDKMGSGKRTTTRGLGQPGEEIVIVSKDDEPVESNKLAPLARNRLSGLVTHLSGRVGRKRGERKMGVNKLTLGGKRKLYKLDPNYHEVRTEFSRDEVKNNDVGNVSLMVNPCRVLVKNIRDLDRTCVTSFEGDCAVTSPVTNRESEHAKEKLLKSECLNNDVVGCSPMRRSKDVKRSSEQVNGGERGSVTPSVMEDSHSPLRRSGRDSTRVSTISSANMFKSPLISHSLTSIASQHEEESNLGVCTPTQAEPTPECLDDIGRELQNMEGCGNKGPADAPVVEEDALRKMFDGCTVVGPELIRVTDFGMDDASCEGPPTKSGSSVNYENASLDEELIVREDGIAAHLESDTRLFEQNETKEIEISTYAMGGFVHPGEFEPLACPGSMDVENEDSFEGWQGSCENSSDLEDFSFEEIGEDNLSGVDLFNGVVHLKDDHIGKDLRRFKIFDCGEVSREPSQFEDKSVEKHEEFYYDVSEDLSPSSVDMLDQMTHQVSLSVEKLSPGVEHREFSTNGSVEIETLPSSPAPVETTCGRDETSSSDDDDDVVILEESFAGPVPGLEFQVLGVGMSVEGNEHEDLLKIFESQDNNGDITSERKSIDAKEEGVVKMRQPIIDDPNIEETIECKKSILMVKEYGFDERSKSSISTSYESQMKVGDQNVGIANVSTPKKIKKCDGNGWFQPKLNEKKLAKDSADGKEAWKVKVVVDNEKYKPSVKDVYKEKKKSPYKNIEQEAVHKLSIGDVFKTSFSFKSFKIPKTKCKKDPGKVAKVTELGDRKSDIVSLNGHSISIKTFLEQEEIVPEVRLESSYEGVGRDQFDTMYERVISIKNSTKKNIPEVDDDVEKEDIDNEGWDALKKMQTDAERNSWVQAQFQNTIPSDPGRNLTVHGFRRQTGQNTALRSAKLSVQTDQVLPSGVKRNIRDDDESEVEPKKIKLSDFGSFMKSVFFMKFNKNIGSRKVLTSDLEAFKTYLGHFKGGLEETSNFLSYYNPRKELDEVQVEEVVDLENQFSTFRNYYGEAEDLFCKQCEKRHKFCQ